MSSIRLNANLRSAILHELIGDKLKELQAKEQAIHDRIAEKAKKVYLAQISKADWAKINSLPKGWLESKSCAYVLFGSYSSNPGRIQVQFGEKIPLPDNTPYTLKLPVDHSATIWAEKEYAKALVLTKEQMAITRKTEVALASVSSVKALKDIWPEAIPAIDRALGTVTETPKPGLPAVQFGELNKQIGLKGKRNA